MSMPSYTLDIVGSVYGFDRAAWNACPAAVNPFLSWDFFAALEDCGAVSASSAWVPAHAALRRGGAIVAYLPLFVVSGSAGSFVWDDGMEEVAAYSGLRWFPKLAGAAPFTPAPVWRPLVVPGEDDGATMAACAEAASEAALAGGFSGAHFHWVDPAFAAALSGGDWLRWDRQAYRWDNAGYASFGDFTGSFSKNMRRNVARDKADVASAGVTARVLRGDEAGPRIWRLMADYYERTNDKFGPWAARFLPRSFFESAAPSRIARDLRFSAAFQGGSDEPIALALLFQGGGGLWGRYWGSATDLPGLHFETCYYAPIAYAIAEGLSFFDPGMGSEHKARRGFRSSLAASFHRVFDPALRRVYSGALAGASAAEAVAVEGLNADLPFKRPPDPPRSDDSSVNSL